MKGTRQEYTTERIEIPKETPKATPREIGGDRL